jgi:peptidoglycan hydrolase CwlO-like protein
MKKLLFTILILFLGINLYAQKTHLIKEDTAFIYVDSKATLAELQEENKSLKVNIVILNNNIKDLQNEIKDKEVRIEFYDLLFKVIGWLLIIVLMLYFIFLISRN